jgi:hypothetical protein
MNNEFEAPAHQTLVTACDSGFIWGAFLLVASLRHSGCRIPMHVLARGLSAADQAVLEQFPDVHIFETADPKPMAFLKPEALLTAQTELVSWVDADCLFTDDPTPWLRTLPGSITIGCRSRASTALMYQVYLGCLPPDEIIPRGVLDIWKSDVGERAEPAIDSTVMTALFTLHREQRWFVQRMQEQIRKLMLDFSRYKHGVFNKASYAYHLAEENVLNSLLAFAFEAPAPKPLDSRLAEKHPGSCFVHFSAAPKPWQAWRPETLTHYDAVLALLDWAREQGCQTPKLTWPLRKACRPWARMLCGYFRVNSPLRQIANGLRRRFLKRGLYTGIYPPRHVPTKCVPLRLSR